MIKETLGVLIKLISSSSTPGATESLTNKFNYQYLKNY